MDDKPAEQLRGTGWAKTLHHDFGNELVRRWDAYEPLRAEIERQEAELASNELAMRAASAGLQMAKAKIERLEAGIRDAIEALERNSTSAPVLEALRALAGKTEPPP